MDILGSTEMSNFEVPERVFGKSIQNIWSDTGMLSFWDFVENAVTIKFPSILRRIFRRFFCQHINVDKC